MSDLIDIVDRITDEIDYCANSNVPVHVSLKDALKIRSVLLKHIRLEYHLESNKKL